MYIKLLKPRTYRGKKYKEGETIEVLPSLGTSFILNNIGIRVNSMPTKEEQTDLKKLKNEELIKLVLKKDSTQTEAKLKKLKKEELIALI